MRGLRKVMNSQERSIYKNSIEFKSRVKPIQSSRERSLLANSTGSDEELLGAIAQIFWKASASGEIIYLNPSWQEFTAMAVEASSGWNFLKAVHPEDRDRLRSAFALWGSQHQPSTSQIESQSASQWEIEFRLLGSDNSYRWMLARAQPRRDETGEIREWWGTYINIDRLKQEQIKLEQKQEFLQSLIESSSVGIIAYTATGQIEIFNQSIRDLLKNSVEIQAESLGKNSNDEKENPPETDKATEWNASVPDPGRGDRESISEENSGKNTRVDPHKNLLLEQLPLWNALQTETASDVEITVVTSNGKIRILLASSNPIFNPAGEKLGAVTMMRDMTKRKEIEEACFSLYAQQEAQIQALNARLKPDGDYPGDRTMANPEGETPIAPNFAAIAESHPSLPSHHPFLLRFDPTTPDRKLIDLMLENLDGVVNYDVAGVLWEIDSQLKLLSQCQRLPIEALWEKIERLLIGTYSRWSDREPLEALRMTQIRFHNNDRLETEMSEIGSMVLMPLRSPTQRQFVGLFFAIAEARNAFSPEQVDTLEQIAENSAEWLQQIQQGSLAENPPAKNRLPDFTPQRNSDLHWEIGLLNRDSNPEIQTVSPGNFQPQRTGQTVFQPAFANDKGENNDKNRDREPLFSPQNDGALPSASPAPEESFFKEKLAENIEDAQGDATPRDSRQSDSWSNPSASSDEGMSGNWREGEELQKPSWMKMMHRERAKQQPTQQERSESEELHAAAIAALPEAVLIYLADGSIRTCNPKAEQLLGRCASDLIGRTYPEPFCDAIAEDGSPFPRDRHPVAIGLGNGQPQSHIVMGIPQPDGTYRWISLNCEPFFPPGKSDLYGVVVSFTDITQRREAERALRQREQRYRAIAEDSNAAVSWHDREGVYLDVSPAFLNLVGYEAEELVGCHLERFVHPEDRNAVKKTRQSLMGEPSKQTIAYRYRRKDGTYLWVETHWRTCINSEDSVVRETIALSRDISDRKQKEEKICALNRELERRIHKQTLQLEAARQLKEELLLRELLARKVAEAAKTLLSSERQQIAQSRSFLAEASSVLASSLDYQTTLENLAGLVVPKLADWCAINAIDVSAQPSGKSNGAYRCVAVAHVDPSKEALVWELQNRYPVDADGTYSYLKQLPQFQGIEWDSEWEDRDDRPHACFDIADEGLQTIARDPEHLHLMRSLDCHSYICLPIRFGSQTFGSILLVRGKPLNKQRGDSPPPYSRIDLGLAEDLVRRAAMALEKALLYREARETGENLRQTVRILDERQRQLRTLQQLANLLNQRIADLPRLLQLMVEAVCEAIPKAQFCPIVLHDRGSDRLTLMATAGKGTQHLPLGLPVKTKDSLLSQVFSTGESRLQRYRRSAAEEDLDSSISLDELPACIYAVPIESARTGRLGVLAVGNWDDAAAFDDEDLRQMVVAVGEQAAIAINNARLIEILEEREDLLQEQNRTLSRQNLELDAKRLQIERQNLQLREASRLKSEFLATMSHELRTPMNAIIGFSQVLLRGRSHQLPPSQKEMVERILSNGKQLLALIDDILELSKIEAGHSQLKLEEFDLDLLVSATCEELRTFAQQKNLTLQFSADLDEAIVVNDRLRLRQVVTNLLSNAIKFTESGGVEVSVWSPAPNQVAIGVRDTGIGIHPQELEHIFEAFRQVDQTITREYPGTGLGLALTDSLVRLMNGTLSVESKLGEGSTFYVQLPRFVNGE